MVSCHTNVLPTGIVQHRMRASVVSARERMRGRVRAGARVGARLKQAYLVVLALQQLVEAVRLALEHLSVG
jgi:hypothetical protein